MFSKTLMALSAGAALCVAAPAWASTTLQFGPPYNTSLGTSETFAIGSGSFTAYGYVCNSVSCSAADIWRKNNPGGDEQGLGLTADPEHEIYWTSDNDYSLIELDVLGLAGMASASFSANSTTQGEMWLLYGSNTAAQGVYGTLLSYGQDESTNHTFDDWGSYRYYSLISYGTLPMGIDPVTYSGTDHTYGNVLLSSLSVTPLPEPGTWAMMLFGFGGIGFAMRRKNAKNGWIAQAA